MDMIETTSMRLRRLAAVSLVNPSLAEAWAGQCNVVPIKHGCRVAKDMIYANRKTGPLSRRRFGNRTVAPQYNSGLRPKVAPSLISAPFWTTVSAIRLL